MRAIHEDLPLRARPIAHEAVIYLANELIQQIPSVGVDDAQSIRAQALNHARC